MSIHSFEFREWPKLPRLHGDKGVLVTEKIDGRNSAVVVGDDGEFLGAQSRKRIITPDDDNMGFAAWAYSYGEDLAALLGPGYHFGEWWGAGIQRRYNQDRKQFSLFNADRWRGLNGNPIPGLRVVPTLYSGNYYEGVVEDCIRLLRARGSLAAPGFDRPEGAVVYFRDARTGFKYVPEGWEPNSKAQTRG